MKLFRVTALCTCLVTSALATPAPGPTMYELAHRPHWATFNVRTDQPAATALAAAVLDVADLSEQTLKSIKQVLVAHEGALRSYETGKSIAVNAWKLTSTKAPLKAMDMSYIEGSDGFSELSIAVERAPCILETSLMPLIAKLGPYSTDFDIRGHSRVFEVQYLVGVTSRNVAASFHDGCLSTLEFKQKKSQYE